MISTPIFAIVAAFTEVLQKNEISVAYSLS